MIVAGYEFLNSYFEVWDVAFWMVLLSQKQKIPRQEVI